MKASCGNKCRRKLKRALAIILRILVPIVALWAFCAHVSSSAFTVLWDVHISADYAGRFAWFFAVILLMFANWLTEARKWQLLTRSLAGLTIWHSLASVWGGLSLSMLSINRSGEFVGRVFFLPAGSRWRGSVASLAGSFAQTLATLAFGLLAFALWLATAPGGVGLSPPWVFGGAGGALLLLVWFIFKAHTVFLCLGLLLSSKRLKRLAVHYRAMPKPVLISVICLSMGRYMLFVLQFFLLALLFDYSGSFLQAFIIIGNVYLFATFLPSISLGEPALRLFAVGLLAPGAELFALSAAVLLLWAVNVGLPALAGAVFFVRRFRPD